MYNTDKYKKYVFGGETIMDSGKTMWALVKEKPEITFNNEQITGIPNTTTAFGNVEFTLPAESK